MNYYFLAASLPLLNLGERIDVSFMEVAERIETNVNENDLQKTAVLRRWIDLKNIRSIYRKEPIDLRGNLTEKDLDQALLLEEALPDYVFDFLNQFEDVSQKLHFFSGVFSAYFREEEKKSYGFLSRYLKFEREMSLVLTAIKAKELHRDVIRELQFEDAKDPFVMHILAQKDSVSYQPPVEWVSLKETYAACGKDPWAQFKELTKWKLAKIEELVKEPLFSIDWILSYMARLLIIEDVTALDPVQGESTLEAWVGSI